MKPVQADRTQLSPEEEYPSSRHVSAATGVRAETRSEILVVFALPELGRYGPNPAEPSEVVSRCHPWPLEDRLPWVRDIDFDEDRSQIRADSGPRVTASLRNLAITTLRVVGAISIAALRHHTRRPDRPIQRS